MFAALILVGCGGGGDGSEGDDTTGAGGNDSTGSDIVGGGGAGSRTSQSVGSTNGGASHGSVTEGTASGGTASGGTASGGTANGGTSGSTGGSGSSVCLGTPSSNCENRFCDQMPGCKADVPPVCGGDPKACSAFDDKTAGCTAQWGCGMGVNGICEEYDTECFDLHSEALCLKYSGCWWSGLYCYGDIVKGCSSLANQTNCAQVAACYWTASSVSYCEGVPTSCASMNSETCEMQSGCTLTPATCSGTPTPCESLSSTECLLQPGCRLANGTTRVIKASGISKHGPDLAFSAFTLKRSLYSTTDELSLVFEEINRGGRNAPAHANRIYLSKNDVFGDADDYELSQPNVGFVLPPYGFDTAVLRTNITMPSAAALAPGYYYPIGVLDSEKTVTELEEANNIVVLPAIYVGPNRFDLVAVSLTHTVVKPLAPADAFDLSLTVRNSSTTSVAAAAATVYISTNTTLDAGDVPANCTTSRALSLGTDATGTFTLNCVSPRARGTYYFLAELDPKDVLKDADRSNNVAVAATTITIAAPSPDLELTAVTSSLYTLKWKGNLKLSATVVNTGVDAAPASTVSFYANGSAFCSASVGALAAGASTTVSKDCTLGAASIGQVPLSARVDPADTIYETDEANNVSDSPTDLTVAPPNINLVAAGFGIKSGGVERKVGDNLEVYFKLQQQGTDNAPAFRFIVYASTDTQITKADTEFCIRDITAGMPAGTTAESSTTCTVVTLPKGNYYLGIIVDTNDAIPETNESDNVAVDSSNQLTITN